VFGNYCTAPITETAMNNVVVIRDVTLRRTAGFVPFPWCVLRDDHELMIPTAKLAYPCLLGYGWDFVEKRLPRRFPDGTFEEFDTVRELMKDLGVSDPTARRALKCLEDRGLIESKRVGQGKPNRFFINQLLNVYPEDPDLSKMTNQDSDSSFLTIQELSKTTTLELSKTPDQAFLTNQDWSKLKEIVRDSSLMTNPNVNVNVNTNDNNVNVVNRQLNLDGLPAGLTARLCEISDEIVACQDAGRRSALELLFRMLEQFKDLYSERFYWNVAQRMPRSDIEMGISYAKGLEDSNQLKKNGRRAFVDFMKRTAKHRNIKITRK